MQKNKNEPLEGHPGVKGSPLTFSKPPLCIAEDGSPQVSG